jgi:Zn-dependent metalloprotease
VLLNDIEYMKKIIGFLLLVPGLAFAQNNAAVIDRAYEGVKTMEQNVPVATFNAVKIPEIDLLLEDRVKAYYKEHLAMLEQPSIGLELIQDKQSKLGRHLLYQQTYKGVPVYNATLKVNVNAAGVTLSVFDQLVNTEGWQSTSFTPNTQLGKAMWIVLEGQPLAAYQRNDGYDQVITDKQGTLIRRKDARLYYTNEDTTVSGKVFLPDPLTSQQVVYGQGGTYMNYNDSDYALLNDARMNVTFPATLEGGIFKLKNQYAIIMDIASPTINPVVSVTPSFDFTRKTSGFKDVMTFYHVTATQQYFQYLGFDEMENYQVKIDAHSGTSDNSFFSFQTDSSLNFGTGGVPDAEDGDVSSHEYTHAMSWFLNATPTMGNERRAMEEGMCDVIAAIMSKKYTDFNWRKLYNFDGPNPTTTGAGSFWGGRNGNSSKKYSNKINDWYSDSEIWSSTILDIVEQIGSDSAAMLMLNTIYSMSANTTMPQAAALYMQADSILFDKYFSWKIGKIFNDRELGNFKTGVAEQAFLQESLKFINTAGFASGEGNAMLELPLDASISVYDLQGKCIKSFFSPKGDVSFDTNEFTSGMYIILVKTLDAQVSLKLIRN